MNGNSEQESYEYNSSEDDKSLPYYVQTPSVVPVQCSFTDFLKNYESSLLNKGIQINIVMPSDKSKKE